MTRFLPPGVVTALVWLGAAALTSPVRIAALVVSPLPCPDAHPAPPAATTKPPIHAHAPRRYGRPGRSATTAATVGPMSWSVRCRRCAVSLPTWPHLALLARCLAARGSVACSCHHFGSSTLRCCFPWPAPSTTTQYRAVVGLRVMAVRPSALCTSRYSPSPMRACAWSWRPHPAMTAPGQPCLTSLFLCRRAVPRQAHSVGQIREIACTRGWSRDLAMRRTLPLLLPAGVKPQFEVPSPSDTLRLHSSACLIPLAPSTSVQFIGTVPSPCSTLSRAYPILPCYCLLSAADVVAPPLPS